VDGAFIIIAWVGIKLLIEYLHKAGYVAFDIPQWLSLGLIIAIFVTALLYSRRQEKPASAHGASGRDAGRHRA